MMVLPEPVFSAHHGSAVSLHRPRHVLMTLDAVGGVWRYAMDLAATLKTSGYSFTFAGFGPPPNTRQRAEAEAHGDVVWLDAPLDWTAPDEDSLRDVPVLISQLVDDREIDLVHLNLPSQAARLELSLPVLTVSHSCTVTWFAAVRGTSVPPDWLWQERLNRLGFEAADMVVAPSQAHASLLRQSYTSLGCPRVVYNGSDAVAVHTTRNDFVFAAGRWWDDGKNGGVLDAAAAMTDWPVVMAGSNHGPNGAHREIAHAQWLGELGHTDVMARMRQAGIFVSPSLYEPFGLAPLEAAGSGAAMVLSDIPTYRELWDGVALFADRHDPKAFAEAINSLVRDPERRRQLGAAARERAGRFTLAAQGRAMQQVYESLLMPSLSRTA